MNRPARPSASSPISGLLPVATSLAMCPQASQQATSASPVRVIADRVVCHGGASAEADASRQGVAQSEGGVRRSGQFGGGGQGSGRAAGLHRSAEAGQRRCRRRPAHRSASVAIFSPTVLGSAAWVSVRASIAVVAGGFRQARPACAPARRFRLAIRDSASRRHSISAVSTTSWLVSPRCSQRAVWPPARSRSSATSPMTGLPSASAPAAIASASAADTSGRQVRACASPVRTPASTRLSSQAVFDVDHRRQERRRRSSGRRRGGLPARTGRSRPMARVAEEDRLLVVAPAGGCRSAGRARRASRSACPAARRAASSAAGRRRADRPARRRG